MTKIPKAEPKFININMGTILLPSLAVGSDIVEAHSSSPQSPSSIHLVVFEVDAPLSPIAS